MKNACSRRIKRMCKFPLFSFAFVWGEIPCVEHSQHIITYYNFWKLYSVIISFIVNFYYYFQYYHYLSILLSFVNIIIIRQYYYLSMLLFVNVIICRRYFRRWSIWLCAVVLVNPIRQVPRMRNRCFLHKARLSSISVQCPDFLKMRRSEWAYQTIFREELKQRQKREIPAKLG